MDQKYCRNSELIMKSWYSLCGASLRPEKWVTRSVKCEKLLAAFLAGFPFPVLCLRKIYRRFLEDDVVRNNAFTRCTGNYCLRSRIENLSLFVKSLFPPKTFFQIADEPTHSRWFTTRKLRVSMFTWQAEKFYYYFAVTLFLQRRTNGFFFFRTLSRRKPCFFSRTTSWKIYQR